MVRKGSVEYPPAETEKKLKFPSHRRREKHRLTPLRTASILSLFIFFHSRMNHKNNYVKYTFIPVCQISVKYV